MSSRQPSKSSNNAQEMNWLLIVSRHQNDGVYLGVLLGINENKSEAKCIEEEKNQFFTVMILLIFQLTSLQQLKVFMLQFSGKLHSENLEREWEKPKTYP